MKNFTLEKTAPYQYITMQQDTDSHEDIVQRCTVDYLQKALEDKGISNAKVIWADIRNGKNLNMEHPLLKNLPPYPFHSELLDELPDFCDIMIEETTPGGHVANVSVWAPLHWNERFLGCGGGGLQTVNDIRLFEGLRSNTIAGSVRNGFATACTDGGIKDERVMSWGLDEATGELDIELIKNWSHRSLHSMTVIGKIITEAVYDKAPKYSYYQGASTGGRMGLVEAQLYPEDYDGVWVDAPATNFARFQMSGSWPLYVMNWHNNSMSEAKLNAFKAAVMEQFANEDGYIDSVDPVPFDAYSVIGRQTEDGPITESDAQVMDEIFKGPHTQEGEKLFYGLLPGTDTWNQGGLGLISYIETEEGTKEPFEFIIPENYVSNWVIQDAQWNYKSMTRDQYERLFRYSQEKFRNIIEGEKADFSAFQKKGGKLMMSHCAGDALVFASGSIELYHRICETMGGEENTEDFLRFYVTPSGSHYFHTELGITLADGMIALMNWVEKEEAPHTLPLEQYDVQSLPAQLLFESEATPYKLSEHPNNIYAHSSIYDEKDVVNKIDGEALTKELKETSKNSDTKISSKRLSNNPLFGSGE
ncbi:tannase/feruloyl esterase family alpha/beta hydrolase [Staphylococcus casei]|uniref:tannase/feruloyl esterase family alpha/beta hydrolase n=1 Tax=Staphylococcus TaxID=1279 RepID=UPI0025703B11|nr:tannase/feruloyl esterase family alpha/beta hydrolase [Staphylococcus casei]WJE86352.1 tannase/feruloyl esterase family alpha/beta hydrolase [Staphylococcus casei]